MADTLVHPPLPTVNIVAYRNQKSQNNYVMRWQLFGLALETEKGGASDNGYRARHNFDADYDVVSGLFDYLMLKFGKTGMEPDDEIALEKEIDDTRDEDIIKTRTGIIPPSSSTGEPVEKLVVRVSLQYEHTIKAKGIDSVPYINYGKDSITSYDKNGIGAKYGPKDTIFWEKYENGKSLFKYRHTK